MGHCTHQDHKPPKWHGYEHMSPPGLCSLGLQTPRGVMGGNMVPEVSNMGVLPRGHGSGEGSLR